MTCAARAVLFAIACAVALSAQNAGPKWVLTFSDEFNGKELDVSKWAPHDPAGRQRDFEVQAYVQSAITESGGSAHIVADRGEAEYDGQNRRFTSGIITSYGSFAQTYGRFEIRCRMPAGKGLEAKFWLLPVPSGDIPSIDVYDAIGSEPTRALFGNLWGDVKTQRSFRGSWAVPDLSADFHTFAIDWDRDSIVWFVDGKQRFRSTDGVPQQPMYVAISLALGSVQAKYPDSGTRFPAAFDIDYVRVYQSPANLHP